MSRYANSIWQARYYDRKAAQVCVKDGCEEPQQAHTVVCVAHDLTSKGGLLRVLCRLRGLRSQYRKNGIYVVLGGERISLAEAARRLGLGMWTLRDRVKRGMTPQQAVDAGGRNDNGDR